MRRFMGAYDDHSEASDFDRGGFHKECPLLSRTSVNAALA
jgi:hypothetical protein